MPRFRRAYLPGRMYFLSLVRTDKVRRAAPTGLGYRLYSSREILEPFLSLACQLG